MIVDLPSTTSAAINKKMVDIRSQGGANAQSRVLTLVIVTDEDSIEEPIDAANGASFEHPCRVIVVARGSKRGAPRLDAQIRVGGDAGASEVVVLRLFGALADHGAAVVVPLLLPDAPVVAWWPGTAPDVPAKDPIGLLAQRRITDAAAARRPRAAIAARRDSYAPGDTDLVWTRLTVWRGLLAAALDQPPHEKVVSAAVSGASDSASADMLTAWLRLRLRCPVRRVTVDRAGTGLRSVVLTRRSGEIQLVRPDGDTATLHVVGQPDRQLSLPRRKLRDCIAEELRRLDADDMYAAVLLKGLPLADEEGPAKAAPKGAAAGRRRVATSAGKTPDGKGAAPRARSARAAKAPAAAADGKKAAAPRTRTRKKEPTP